MSEMGAKNIYSYSMNGKLLNKKEVNGWPSVRYSSNGEFVSFMDMLGRRVIIFTNKGTIIFEGDYIELIKDNQKVLENFFVSNDGKLLLLNTSGTLNLFDLSGKNIWNISFPDIWECTFFENQELIIVCTSEKVLIKNSKDVFNLKIISAKDGTLIETIENISLFKSSNNWTYL